MKITAVGILTYDGSVLKVNGIDLAGVIAERFGVDASGCGEKVCDIYIDITDLGTYCIVDGERIGEEASCEDV